MTFKIALIEDEKEYADNVADYFLYKGARVVAKTAGVYELINLKVHTDDHPDIILLDNNLSNNEYGIDHINDLKDEFPSADIIILTSHDDSKFIFSALCNGAIGYLIKGIPLSNIYSCVNDVLQGGSCMSPSIARKVFNYFSNRNTNNSKLDQLTSREYEIAEGIRDGLSYKLIAERLNISIETVRFHVKNTYRKLHVNSKSEVVSAFYKNDRY